MTMENDLVERLRAPMVMSMYLTQADLYADAMAQRAEAASRIQALEAELAAALIEVSKQARLRGEAEGKLHVSELAGIVEGWQLRAERAEAERDEALERAERWKDTAGAEAEAFEEQKAQTKRAEAELARKTEALRNCAALLEGVAEDAQKDGDTATWALTSVKAENARSALEEKTDV